MLRSFLPASQDVRAITVSDFLAVGPFLNVANPTPAVFARSPAASLGVPRQLGLESQIPNVVIDTRNEHNPATQRVAENLLKGEVLHVLRVTEKLTSVCYQTPIRYRLETGLLCRTADDGQVRVSFLTLLVVSGPLASV